jgi:hypothetical protein
VCDYLEFVQSEISLNFPWRSCVRLAALAAFSVNDDTCAVAVRTEDSVFEIKGFLLVHPFAAFLSERSAALHAVLAFLGDVDATGGARFSDDFFMTVGAFHNVHQLFLDVFT